MLLGVKYYMSLQFEFKKKSFILVGILGVFAALLTVLLDFFPHDNIWTLSSFSGSFGFWGFSTAVIVYLSTSKKAAGLNSFIYLAMMSVFFYIFKGISDTLNGVADYEMEYLWLGISWIIASAICGIFGVITFLGKRNDIFGSFIFSLPLAVILSEGISCMCSVIINEKYLFQTIFNFIAAVLLYILFIEKKSHFKTLLFTGGITAIFVVIMYYTDYLIIY